MSGFKIYARKMFSFALFGVLFVMQAQLGFASESTTDIVILKQLGELRKEIQSLRKEVGELRKDFKKVSRPSSPPVIPPPKRIEISQSNTRILGDSEATVGVMEFTDYQCPFCQRFHDKTFSKLKETYIDSGKIRFITRDFPLANHAEADDAAIATRCADRQGKFWEMREGVFENQARLGPELYKELAKKLALDGEEFLICQKDSKELMAVDVDQAYGQSIGVTGTPSFFIGRMENGILVDIKRVAGAQPFAQFSRIIDPLLQ